VKGTIGNEEGEFLVGIGKGAQAKHMFRAGDVVRGEYQPVQDENLETVEFYKTSKLKVLRRPYETDKKTHPWLGMPPDLKTYRQRGHKRLDVHTYQTKCWSCK
jgi:hypothetical protein